MTTNTTPKAPRPDCCRHSMRNMKRTSKNQTGRVTYKCQKCGRVEILEVEGL